MRALMTGGTGLIGRALMPRFSSAMVLTRDPGRARGLPEHAEARAWDPMAEPAPVEAFAGVDVVVNLAGASIGEGRWTDSRKRVLRDSRIGTTGNLIEGLRRTEVRPKLLISSSAVGFYGDRGEEELDESSAAGSGFLAELCIDWEKAATAARELGMRVVILRTAMAIDGNAPAFQKLRKLFGLGLGGPLGDGRQWMPWVHLEDLVSLIQHAVDRQELAGAVNAVAPETVRNEEFTREMARAVHRPAFLAAPAFGLRLILGEFADALLASQRIVPRAAADSGFVFRYPGLRSALEKALS